MTTTAAPIYVLDDDASVREAVARLVRSAGWKVETFGSAQEFLASPWADVPSCLILDVQLPGLSGLDLQQRLAKSGARTSIMFLTGHGDIPTSVRAIKAGALEFLTKPYADEDLIAAIEQGLALAEQQRADGRAREERLDARIQSVAGGRDGGRPAIGQSAEWKDVLRKATQVAATETTVLLQGESGTGKEVVARFIHRASPRKARTVRRDQLRRPAGPPAGIGAVRVRTGRLHRRAAAQARADRAGVGRRAVPRRSDRDERGRAGEAAPRAAGTRVPAARRDAAAEGQRPRDRGDEPRPA